MTKKKILGLISLALLIFAFMLGQETSTGFCIGDTILRSLGLQAWSLEPTSRARGFHYTFIMFLLTAIIGYTGARCLLKDAYPKLVRELPMIVIILFFFSNQLFDNGYHVVQVFSEGINAVDYKVQESRCDYEIKPGDKVILYKYKIVLKNYSREQVSFRMKVQKPDDYKHIMADVAKTDKQGKSTPRIFTLPAGEQGQFAFVIKEPNPNNSNYYNGTMNRPDIILYNQNNSRVFKVHY